MKFAIISLSVVLAGVRAHPVHQNRAAADLSDTALLNYGLTLEYTQSAFYKEALKKFDDNAFTQAGFPAGTWARYQQIHQHEEDHIAFLSGVLGDKATKPCTYKFPYTDMNSFLALSELFEGLGVTAYNGIAQHLSNKDHITAAASIMAAEARHSSWVGSFVKGFAGWSTAFEAPLSPDQVLTIVGDWIKSCPSTNPKLLTRPFPAVIFPAGARPGANVAITFDSFTPTFPANVAFMSGLSQVIVPVKNGKVMIPKELKGTVYAVVTSSTSKATNGNIIAGPAVLQFEFDPKGKLVAQ